MKHPCHQKMLHSVPLSLGLLCVDRSALSSPPKKGRVECPLHEHVAASKAFLLAKQMPCQMVDAWTWDVLWKAARIIAL